MIKNERTSKSRKSLYLWSEVAFKFREKISPLTVIYFIKKERLG